MKKTEKENKEIKNLKKKIEEMTDEDLDKVAGGEKDSPCPSGYTYFESQNCCVDNKELTGNRYDILC